MEFTYTQQMIIVSLVISLPVGILLLLMKLRVLPPALATIGGASLIFLKNYFNEIVTSKYGFSENAIVGGNYVGMAVLAISLFLMYKEYKKWEKRQDET